MKPQVPPTRFFGVPALIGIYYLVLIYVGISNFRPDGAESQYGAALWLSFFLTPPLGSLLGLVVSGIARYRKKTAPPFMYSYIITFVTIFALLLLTKNI